MAFHRVFSTIATRGSYVQPFRRMATAPNRPMTAAKLAKAASAAGGARPGIEVEQDVEKLCKYCCGANIYKTGEDPEIKADSEYPDWLWELHIEHKAVPLEELQPGTPQYWRRLRKYQMGRHNRLKKIAFK